MENLEHFIEIAQQKRLSNQQKLEELDKKSDEYRKITKELRDLKRQTKESKNNILKQLNVLASHRRTIHKIVHSMVKTGLPVPHKDIQDVKTMFAEVIKFLNSIESTCETLDNIKKNMNYSEMIELLTTCTEDVGNKLYQTRHHIMQLEILKKDLSLLQIPNNNSSNNSEEAMDLTTNDESNKSMDNESAIK
ncbi:hypothetical protein EAI_17063 [Harpegnathos saltator]|uniref:Uncharacterized protein n=1 Tax=Harpegnathos saltator TaxID=610380 RepID=E2B4F5_HARSA|nr:hypothetical protein EAI_17063 [Harpegnathos saltator]